MPKTCSIEGCDRPKRSRGWCHTHYIRWYRHGDPLAVASIHRDDARRFWSKVEQTDSCWIWRGTRRPDSRGTLNVARRTTLAHRFAYELLVGPIPEGLTVDHLCFNPSCVNPAHLEPVTNEENLRRAGEAVTHCPRGHEYTPENTYLDPNPNGTHGRQCRACMTERNRARKHQPITASSQPHAPSSL